MYNLNLLANDDQKVVDRWPELGELPAWKNFTSTHKDKVYRYAILMYSMHSDLHRTYPKIKERRVKALHDAGFSKKSDGTYGKFAEESLNWDNDEVREIFLQFIKYQNEPKWAQLVTLENMFWENLEHMNRPLSNGNRDKAPKDEDRLKALDLKARLMDQNEKILESIDNLKHQLFRDDEDAIHSFRRQAINSPEKFAKRHKLKAEAV